VTVGEFLEIEAAFAKIKHFTPDQLFWLTARIRFALEAKLAPQPADKPKPHLTIVKTPTRFRDG
jgi:hypothetical protein